MRKWLLSLILFAGIAAFTFTFMYNRRHHPVLEPETRSVHVEFDNTVVPILKETKKKSYSVSKPPTITIPYTSSQEDIPMDENDSTYAEFSEAFFVPALEKIIMMADPVEQPVKEKVYYMAEEMPLFNGGKYDTFREWIANNLKYPEIAVENGISGRVLIQFAVDSKGEVCDIQLVKGIDPTLNQEAIRVISSSPKWSPGKIKGKPVKVQFSFPVFFELK